MVLPTLSLRMCYHSNQRFLLTDVGFCSLLGNVLVSVFELLNLNPVMNVMFNPPSIMIATVRINLAYPVFITDDVSPGCRDPCRA